MTERNEMTDRSAKLRRFYAEMVAGGAAAGMPDIAAALAAVPREPFAGPGPWSIPRPGSGGPGRTAPDATCWYAGGDWWLSTREP